MSPAKVCIPALERTRGQFKLISQRNRTALHWQFKKWKATNPVSKIMTLEQLEEVRLKMKAERALQVYLEKGHIENELKRYPFESISLIDSYHE